MSKPQYYEIVVACLLKDNVGALRANFMAQYEPLMQYIRYNYESSFTTTAVGLDLKSKNRPRVVLMVTEDVTKIGFVHLRSELARYVQTGGTLILCCWFAAKSNAMGIDSLLWEFHCDWTVKEGLEEFVRVNLTLNAALKQKLGQTFNLLEPTYAIQAIHIQGVSVADRVYLGPSENEIREVAAIDPNAESTPSAFRKHGRGFLGYVGDVGLESGTQALILSMIQAGAPAARQFNKQAFAGLSVNPPANLVHATPPSKYNLAPPASHNNPSAASPLIIQTSSSEIAAIITRDPVNEPNPPQTELAAQDAEAKTRTDTTIVRRFALSVSSESSEDTDDEDAGVAVGTQMIQYTGLPSVGASNTEIDSDSEDTLPMDKINLNQERALVVVGSPAKEAIITYETDMPSLAPCNPGCAVCTILYPAYRCTVCRAVQYCSQQCQAKDWAQHKLVCESLSEVEKGQDEPKVSSIQDMDLYGSD